MATWQAWDSVSRGTQIVDNPTMNRLQNNIEAIRDYQINNSCSTVETGYCSGRNLTYCSNIRSANQTSPLYATGQTGQTNGTNYTQYGCTFFLSHFHISRKGTRQFAHDFYGPGCSDEKSGVNNYDKATHDASHWCQGKSLSTSCGGHYGFAYPSQNTTV